VPRSSALDVAPKTRSSWNTRAFSRPGDSRASSARPAAARTAAADHYLARVGPTHRSIEHAIGRVGRSDRSAQRGRVRDSQILRGRTDAAGSYVGRLPCEDRWLLPRGARPVRRMAHASGYGVHRPGGADRRETALPAPTLPAGRGGSPRGGLQLLAAETALDALDRGAWADGGASTLFLVRGFDRAIQAAKRRIALSCKAAALREGSWGVCRGEPSVR